MKRHFIALLCAALLCAILPFASAFAEANETPGIAGSNVQALLSDLEAFGIPTPKPETSGQRWESGDCTVDGVECEYTITANSAGQIKQARFSMDGKNDLLERAAALTYDAASPERAAKFVKSNLGKQATTIIGDARFTMGAGDGLLITARGMKRYTIYSLEINYDDTLARTGGVMARVTKAVNLRAEPNSDSARVGKAQEGDQLLVITPYYTEKWHQISYDGQVCYVSANYCEL